MKNFNGNNNGSNNNDSKNQNKNGFMKYGMLMMLCCLIPILLVAGLPLFGIKSVGLSSLIFLLCPLMHVGMVIMMIKNGRKGSCHDDRKQINQVDN